MKDRIKQLMEAQHMNQQTFANYTGIGTASLSSIFTGRTRPTLNHVDAILEKFPNVNPLWLLKGIGGMMSAADDNVNAKDASQPESLNGSSNSTVVSGKGANQSSATLSVETNLFANHNASHQGSNSRPNGNAKSPVGFQFEEEQKTTVRQRKITEIRVFYDDQTWESFTPKKDK